MASSSTLTPARLMQLRHERPRTQRVLPLVFAGWLALLIFGPLAFGAVEAWSTLVQQAGAAALAALLIWHWLKDEESKLHPNALYGCWGALAILVVLQIALRVPVYMEAAVTAALQGVAYLLVFFVGNECLKVPARVQTAARVLTIFGFALALYSILQSFIEPGKLLGFRAPHSSAGVYGPYVNHSHYAGLMEMLVAFPLVLAFRGNLSRTQRGIYGGAAFLMAASIFLSESRGGMLAFAVEFIFLAALVLMQSRKRRLNPGIIAATGLFIIFLFWLGAGRLERQLGSFRHPGVSIAMRKAIDRDTLRMTAARPWLGWGLGNFGSAYPQFRSFYTNLVVDEAHNDYLQYLAELGIIGAFCIAWFLITVVRKGWRNVDRWEQDSVSSAKMAALLGILGMAVHALSDFNMQIHANAALFFALCAMTTVRSVRDA